MALLRTARRWLVALAALLGLVVPAAHANTPLIFAIPPKTA